MGRGYSDEVAARLGSFNAKQPSTSPVPSPGAGSTLEITNEDLDGYQPDGFLAPTDGPSVRPLAPYELLVEGSTPGRGRVRIGENWIAAPSDPGIAAAAPANFPSASTQILKAKSEKLGRGLFTDIVGDLSTNTGQDFRG